MRSAMQQFARGLQIVALFLLPLGMIMQIFEAITVGRMLVLWVSGISLFWIGRIIEGYLRT